MASKIKLGKAYKDADGTIHGKINGLGAGTVEFATEAVVAINGTTYQKLIADPMGDAYEIGALFPQKKGELEYYSVSLESPFLPAPISAALFPDKSSHNGYYLIWNRPEARPALANDRKTDVQQQQAALPIEQLAQQVQKAGVQQHGRKMSGATP